APSPPLFPYTTLFRSTAPAEASTSVSSMENDLQRAIDLAREARRPVFVLGVGARQSAAPLRAVLSATDAPVLSTYRAKGVIPDRSEEHTSELQSRENV